MFARGVHILLTSSFGFNWNIRISSFVQADIVHSLFLYVGCMPVTPRILVGGCSVTSGMEMPPWTRVLWCATLLSLQDGRPYFFPRCQEKPLDIKPSSRTAWAEEFLCLMSLSFPKSSRANPDWAVQGVSPLSSQQRAHPPWEHLRGSAGPAFQSCSLPFLSTGVDPENNPPTNLLKVNLGLRDYSLGIHLAQTLIGSLHLFIFSLFSSYIISLSKALKMQDGRLVSNPYLSWNIQI